MRISSRLLVSLIPKRSLINILIVFTENNDMPLVFVALIGLAISLGVMVLIVLAGLALDRYRKKREGYIPAPTSMFDRGSGMQRIPPHELLHSLNQGIPGAPHV